MFSLGVWAPARVTISVSAMVTRIFLMSLRFSIISRGASLAARTSWLREFLHQIRELREQIMRIVRPGRRFRVVLHAEKRQRLVAHALIGVVVQIDVRDFDLAGWQGFRIDAKAVILHGDFDLFRYQVFHRSIRALMPECQLE